MRERAGMLVSRTDRSGSRRVWCRGTALGLGRRGGSPGAASFRGPRLLTSDPSRCRDRSRCSTAPPDAAAPTGPRRHSRFPGGGPRRARCGRTRQAVECSAINTNRGAWPSNRVPISEARVDAKPRPSTSTCSPDTRPASSDDPNSGISPAVSVRRMSCSACRKLDRPASASDFSGNDDTSPTTAPTTPRAPRPTTSTGADPQPRPPTHSDRRSRHRPPPPARPARAPPPTPSPHYDRGVLSL